MTHTITIRTDNAAKFEKVKDLAESLGLSVLEKHEDTGTKSAAQQFLDLQKRVPPRRISPNININSIIDEVNL